MQMLWVHKHRRILAGKTGIFRSERVREGSKSEYDPNTLHICIKLSKLKY